MRIVPAMAGSAFPWMMGLHVQEYPAGRFVHPKTLERRKQSVFNYAYTWMKEHHPEALYSKENKTWPGTATTRRSAGWFRRNRASRTYP